MKRKTIIYGVLAVGLISALPYVNGVLKSYSLNVASKIVNGGNKTDLIALSDEFGHVLNSDIALNQPTRFSVSTSKSENSDNKQLKDTANSNASSKILIASAAVRQKSPITFLN